MSASTWMFRVMAAITCIAAAGRRDDEGSKAPAKLDEDNWSQAAVRKRLTPEPTATNTISKATAKATVRNSVVPKVQITLPKTGKERKSVMTQALNKQIKSSVQSAKVPKTAKKTVKNSEDDEGDLVEELKLAKANQDKNICTAGHSDGFDASWTLQFPKQGKEGESKNCECQCDIKDCGVSKCPDGFKEEEEEQDPEQVCSKFDETGESTEEDLKLPKEFEGKTIVNISEKEQGSSVYKLTVESDCSATAPEDGGYRIKSSSESCTCTFEVEDEANATVAGEPNGESDKSTLGVKDGKLFRKKTGKKSVRKTKDKVWGCRDGLKQEGEVCVRNLPCPKTLGEDDARNFYLGLLCAPKQEKYRNMTFKLLEKYPGETINQKQCYTKCIATFTTMTECHAKPSYWPGRTGNEESKARVHKGVGLDSELYAKSLTSGAGPANEMYTSSVTETRETRNLVIKSMLDLVVKSHYYLTNFALDSSFVKEIFRNGCRSYANGAFSDSSDGTLSSCLKKCARK